MCPFENNPDNPVEWNVSEFYKTGRDKRAVGPLVQMINSGIPDLKMAAIEALGGIKTKESLDTLSKLMHDDDLNVREAAEKSYYRIRKEQKEDEEDKKKNP